MNSFVTMKVQRKLAVMVAVVALPLACVSYLVIADKSTELALVKKEQIGMEYLQPLREVLQSFALHRGLTDSVISGATANRDRQDEVKKTATKQVAEFDAIIEKHADALLINNQWSLIKRDWQTLEAGATSQSRQDIFDHHSALIIKTLDLIGRVGAASNLIMDPELDSYYLTDVLINRIPQLAEDLGLLRATAASLAVGGVVSQQEYGDKFTLLISVYGQIQQASKENVKVMKMAFAQNPNLESLLGNITAEFNRTVAGYLELITRQVIDVTDVTIPSSKVFAEGTLAVNSAFQLYDQTSAALYNLLQQRAARITRIRLFTLGSTLLTALLSMALVYWSGRIILQQLGAEPDALRQVTANIAAGDLSFSFEHGSGVNTGVFAAMQTLQTRLTSVINEDISTLVDGVRRGDLSKRIDLQNKQGFYAELSSGINDLVSVNEQIVTDTARVFAAMAEGDLSTTIDSNYQGSFDQLKKNANRPWVRCPR